ncbi:hypothetical protein KFL_009440010 [Klebsormidium nitens]|uniref:GRAM domain-containing protein n=1 Tax=Klebsormidium nitens TaxID=105231 RepID=A0A1Y1IRR7_KLENI|nr:hypothetical protein KFL_009440010 [Klebsormidium nitens]|eukprot:GAQ92199.1 hypothetical protein KFL_009440010 [Klebsormidium nitens]
MEFGGLSMLEIANKYEAAGQKKEENSLTEPPVLVNKSDAEPDGGPEKTNRKEANFPDDEPNPAEEALKEASLAAQQAAQKAAAAVSQLGGKLSTWWTNLDPPAGTESQINLADSRTLDAAPQVAQEVNLQSTFGLGAEENLIEAFACTLVQTYRCLHNGYTPELVKTYRGTLYITEKHTCFLSTSDGETETAFTLEHAKVTSVLRQSPTRANQSATLKLVQSSDNWIAVQDFASDEELESAFALLEHKTDETS